MWQNMNDNLYVNEIFYSIDGEGKRTGCPSVFVRLAGCNLRCNYCDTEYAFSEGDLMQADEIMKTIKSFYCKNVTITGGEPLLQKNTIKLLKQLSGDGYRVIVETNGAVNIVDAQKYASICMDWKMPSSGMSSKMLLRNISKLRKDDSLKLVVRNEDLEYAKKILYKWDLECPVYISPVFGDVKLSDIAEFVKSYHGGNTVLMQLQIHKYIWKPEERGV